MYFSLTALDLLLVFFHFKNESTDLIYSYTCLFSPLFTLRHMLCLATVYKDITQNMHFDVVLSSGGQSTQIKYLSKNTDTYNKILLQ